MTSSRIYAIWNGMKARCYVKSQGEYKHYGAKGIKVCDEWLYDFMAFYTWAINNGYSDELSIDRIDYKGNYEPSNCRWATNIEQGNNRSNNIHLSFNKETHTIAEWSRIVGIKPATLQYRKYIGMNDEDAITAPLRKSSTKPIIEVSLIPETDWVIIGGRKYYNEKNGYLYRDDFSGIIHKLGISVVKKALNKYEQHWKARQVCQRLARIKQLKQQ